MLVLRLFAHTQCFSKTSSKMAMNVFVVADYKNILLNGGSLATVPGVVIAYLVSLCKMETNEKISRCCSLLKVNYHY